MRSSGKPFADSFGPFPADEPWTRLSPEWQQFTIDLAGADTSSLLGGFCFATNAPHNPNGCEFFLDDIVLVADKMPILPPPAVAPPPVKPDGTNAIPAAIREAQRQYVRESWGEQAGECFTDDDYTEFNRQRLPEKIVAEVLGKPQVQAAIITLRKTPEADRRNLTDTWRKPLRPTWAQMSRISREGQTDAGQRAETDIANAIVDAVLKQCSAPTVGAGHGSQ